MNKTFPLSLFLLFYLVIPNDSFAQKNTKYREHAEVGKNNSLISANHLVAKNETQKEKPIASNVSTLFGQVEGTQPTGIQSSGSATVQGAIYLQSQGLSPAIGAEIKYTLLR